MHQNRRITRSVTMFGNAYKLFFSFKLWAGIRTHLRLGRLFWSQRGCCSFWRRCRPIGTAETRGPGTAPAPWFTQENGPKRSVGSSFRPAAVRERGTTQKSLSELRGLTELTPPCDTKQADSVFLGGQRKLQEQIRPVTVPHTSHLYSSSSSHCYTSQFALVFL